MKKVYVLALCLLMGSSSAFAACVTSIAVSTPTFDFTDNNDGTVTHSKTGLMWKQCSEGLSGAGCATGVVTTLTWQGALQAAEALNAGGGFASFTDWRVPNIKELASIVEEQCTVPAINTAIFPATVSSWYWSASPYAGFATFAWTVYFNLGHDYAHLKAVSGYVRLVRGGQ